jgi:hypothetical protein
MVVHHGAKVYMTDCIIERVSEWSILARGSDLAQPGCCVPPLGRASSRSALLFVAVLPSTPMIEASSLWR